MNLNFFATTGDGFTLGQLADQGYERLRLYCEMCRRMDFADLGDLTLTHGRRLPIACIPCDSCGEEDLLCSPSGLGRYRSEAAHMFHAGARHVQLAHQAGGNSLRA